MEGSKMKIELIDDYETIKIMMNEEMIEERYLAIFLVDYLIDSKRVDINEIVKVLEDQGFDILNKCRNDSGEILDEINMQIYDEEISLRDVIDVLKTFNEEFYISSISDYIDNMISPDSASLDKNLERHIDYASYLRDLTLNGEIMIVKWDWTATVVVDLNP
jgi:hypothetical protein